MLSPCFGRLYFAVADYDLNLESPTFNLGVTLLRIDIRFILLHTDFIQFA